MSKRKTKVQKFLKELSKILISAGAVIPGELGYEWQINTAFGVYSCSTHHKLEDKRVDLFHIFGMFSDTKRAILVFSAMNSNSGKYNFYNSDSLALLVEFRTFLEKATGREVKWGHKEGTL